MTKIVMADGTEYESYMFLPNDLLGIAHIGLTGVGMAEALAIMDNSEKTKRMTCDTVVADGYTELQLLTLEKDGVRVQMGRKYD